MNLSFRFCNDVAVDLILEIKLRRLGGENDANGTIVHQSKGDSDYTPLLQEDLIHNANRIYMRIFPPEAASFASFIENRAIILACESSAYISPRLKGASATPIHRIDMQIKACVVCPPKTDTRHMIKKILSTTPDSQIPAGKRVYRRTP